VNWISKLVITALLTTAGLVAVIAWVSLATRTTPMDRYDRAGLKKNCEDAGGKASFTYITEGNLAGWAKTAKCTIPAQSN